jgi:phosphotransferase system HPr (HPr) family protein
MVKTNLIIHAQEGLHARPAHLFCMSANKFQSEILVRNVSTDSTPVTAKSILMILTLGVISGHEIEIKASGADEEDALKCLQVLVENNFPG